VSLLDAFRRLREKLRSPAQAGQFTGGAGEPIELDEIGGGEFPGPDRGTSPPAGPSPRGGDGPGGEPREG
jgi:hypothetical protein